MTKCEIAHSFIYQTLMHQLQVKMLDKAQPGPIISKQGNEKMI